MKKKRKKKRRTEGVVASRSRGEGKGISNTRRPSLKVHALGIDRA